MNKKDGENWIILIILSIIWGSSFILIKKGLQAFNYLEVASLRLIIAFIILIPFVISSLKKCKIESLTSLIIVSLIGTVLPAILFAQAQTHLNSSLTGMLNSLTPIFTLFLGVLFFNKKTHPLQFAGLIISMTGTYMLLSPSGFNGEDFKYSSLIILASVCYGLSINIIRNNLKEMQSLDIAVITSFLSAIIPIIYITNSGTKEIIMKISLNLPSFYYLIVLGTIGTSIAIIIFNHLIKRSSAVFASTTTYLIPIFAIIWGLIDGETIYKNEYIAIIIVLFGVFIMNRKK